MKTSKKGFSLIELMVTLVTLSILLTVAIPSMNSLINRVRIHTEITELMEGFTLARSYAVSSSSYVTVCGSSNSRTCDGDWETGLFAYSHDIPDADYIDNVSTPHLYTRNSTNSFTTIGNIRKFTFRPSGLLRGRSGSLLYCPTDQVDNLRRIVVSRGGRIRAYTKQQLEKIRYLSPMTCT